MLVAVVQTIGGAFCISASQSAFENRLVSTLATTVPGLDPNTVIATGATQIRSTFSANQVTGIVVAYMAGLKVVFELAVAVTGFTVVMCLFLPWKRINMGSAGDGMA
jgi:hypothetical protein